MFLKKMWHGEIAGSRTCDFNQEIPDHNWYPTKEEIEEIDSGLENSARNKLKEFGYFEHAESIRSNGVGAENSDPSADDQQAGPSRGIQVTASPIQSAPSAAEILEEQPVDNEPPEVNLELENALVG